MAQLSERWISYREVAGSTQLLSKKQSNRKAIGMQSSTLVILHSDQIQPLAIVSAIRISQREVASSTQLKKQSIGIALFICQVTSSDLIQILDIEAALSPFQPEHSLMSAGSENYILGPYEPTIGKSINCYPIQKAFFCWEILLFVACLFACFAISHAADRSWTRKRQSHSSAITNQSRANNKSKLII